MNANPHAHATVAAVASANEDAIETVLRAVARQYLRSALDGETVTVSVADIKTALRAAYASGVTAGIAQTAQTAHRRSNRP